MVTTTPPPNTPPWPDMLAEMASASESQSINNIDNALESLTDIYSLTTSQIVPVEIHKRSSVPWWNSSLQDLRTKTNSLRRRYQKTRTDDDWQAYKSTKKLHNQTIHTSKLDCFKNYCKDQHSPWHIINNILTHDTKNKQISPLKIQFLTDTQLPRLRQQNYSLNICFLMISETPIIHIINKFVKR